MQAAGLVRTHHNKSRKLRWPIRVLAGLLALTAFTQTSAANPPVDEFSPQAFPVVGLPSEISQAWCAIYGPRGIAVATKEGIIIPVGSGWRFVPSPTHGPVVSIEETPDGYFAGGVSLIGRYDGQWHTTPIQDLVGGGIPTVEGVIATGTRHIYLFDRADRLRPLFPAAPAVVSRVVFRDAGGIYLLSGSEKIDGYRWDGAAFTPTDRFAYLPPEHPGYATELDGLPLFFSGKKLFHGKTQILDATLGEQFAKDLPVELKATATQVIVATLHGGIYGLSADGQLRWHQSPEALEGKVQAMSLAPGGVLFTTNRRLGFLPDPLKFRYRTIRDLNLRSLEESETGVEVTADEASFRIHEREQKPGTYILSHARNGAVELFGHWGGQLTGSLGPIQLKTQPGIMKLSPLGQGFMAAGTPSFLIGLDARGREVFNHDLGLPITSLAQTAAGNVLVGTEDGVLTYSPDFQLLGRFGQGRLKVKRSGGEAWAFASSGEVFDHTGRLVTRVACRVLHDIACYQGKLIGLVGGDAGWVAVGFLGPWRPLLVPGVTGSTRWLAVEGDVIYLASPELMIEARSPELLKPFALNPSQNLKPIGAHIDLPAATDDFSFDLPHSIFPGMPAPALTYAVDKADPVAVHDGLFAFPRLPWGTTTIQLRADYAGLISEQNLTIVRAYPGWLSPWSFVAYLSAVATALYGLYRWRTSVLRARADALEHKVAERTAELVQAKQAREYFISAMSHEIRNPLNGVVGLCDILRDTATSAREQTLTATLQGCADQLRRLLDDVLDWSKIERREIEVHSEPLEVNATIEAACRSMDVTLSRVTLTLPAPCWVEGDIVKIRQIIMNLVGNALKHGSPAQAAVRAEIKPADSSRMLIVTVSNPGADLSAEEWASIFEEFHQRAATREQRLPGLGLGLNISRRLAEVMGGTLTGRSSDGQIEFTLTLPLPVAREPAPIRTPDATTAPPLRVLAVEDEPYNRLVLGHLLEQLHCIAEWAEDGQAALNCARATRYDLILTDYYLPDFSGAVLAEKLRALLGASCPPIVAVTAYSSPEKIAEGTAAGISLFITKPISRAKLAPVLARYATSATADSELDFGPILRLKDGPVQLAAYGASLLEDWAACEPFQGENATRAIHALRSKVLLVRATSLARQLELLEAAARRLDQTTAKHLAQVVAPLLHTLAAAVKRTTHPQS